MRSIAVIILLASIAQTHSKAAPAPAKKPWGFASKKAAAPAKKADDKTKKAIIAASAAAAAAAIAAGIVAFKPKKEEVPPEKSGFKLPWVKEEAFLDSSDEETINAPASALIGFLVGSAATLALVRLRRRALSTGVQPLLTNEK